MQTSPSNRCPRATSSIESAITSRDTSDARMPTVPIDTPSRDGDRVELDRRPARAADALLHVAGEQAMVEIARHRLDPRRRDADQRLREVLVGEARALEHRARRRAVDAVGQRRTVPLGGIASGRTRSCSTSGSFDTRSFGCNVRGRAPSSRPARTARAPERRRRRGRADPGDAVGPDPDSVTPARPRRPVS